MLTISAPCAGYFPDGKFGLCCSPRGKKCDQCGWNPREDRKRRRALRSGNVPLQIRRKGAEIDSEPKTPANTAGEKSKRISGGCLPA